MTETVDFEAVAGRLMGFFTLLSGVLVEANVVKEGASTEDVVGAVRSLLLERETLRAELERSDLLIDGLNETVAGLEENFADWQEFTEVQDRRAIKAEQALALERRTLIKVAALGTEYKHAVEHVASCGGTCQDCRRLAQSAMAHENLDAILEAEYLAVMEYERARLAETVERLESDLGLLRHQTARDRKELVRLTATVRRTRRAARAFVRMALESFARKTGVELSWEIGDREGLPPGSPKNNGRLAVEIGEALDRMVGNG